MNDAVNALASQEQKQIELLPLDAVERVAVFRSKGATYRHIFKRLRQADWENFFAHVMAEFKQEKEGVTQVLDTDYASEVLWSRVILRVEGYKTENGVLPNEMSNWPWCIPEHHRRGAAAILMELKHPVTDESMLQADGVSVAINAVWNESVPGEMKQYFRRVHRFASPTQEHKRRFLKSKSKALIAGGSRTGTTVIPSAHPLLVKLYDELIERVEGYSVAGRELASKEEIVREMDAFHKSATIGRVFRSPGEVEMVGANAE